MKKKIILMSLLSIVMCASLITGATLALFTSESQVNIIVSSGKVAAVATLGDITTYSMGEERADDTFANGGAAAVGGATLTMNKVMPGDKAVVEVNVENSSTVAVKYRVRIAGEGDAQLLDQLLVGYSADKYLYTYYSEFVSDWGTLAEGKTTSYLSVELPSYVADNAMGKVCELTVAVEVMQGNGPTDETSVAKKVYPVTTQEELVTALTNFADGETIVFYGGNWDTGATIAFEGAKTLNVRGLTLDKLTINALDGTVNVYNNLGELETVAIADDSLHIYGKIASMEIQQGRAVLEAGASVETITVVPAASSTAKVEISEAAKVESITVDSSAESATAEIKVAENVTVPNFDVVGDGDVVIDNSGEIGLSGMKIDTAAKLLIALQIGGTVDLAGDITTSQQLIVKENISVTLKLHGYDLIGTNAGSLLCNYGEMYINGTPDSFVYTTDIDAQGRHALVNYGTMTVNGGVYGDKNADRTDVNDIQRGNAVRNYGVMTIESGSFTCCDNYTNGGYAYVIANGDSGTTDAVLTIVDADVYGNMNGVLAADGGKMIVNGGNYLLGNGSAGSCYRMAYTSDYGVIEINAGTFKRNVDNNNAFFGAYFAHSEDSENIIINGGTFTDAIHGTIKVDGSGDADDAYGGYYGGYTVINGGTFSGEIQGTMVKDNRQSA